MKLFKKKTKMTVGKFITKEMSRLGYTFENLSAITGFSIPHLTYLSKLKNNEIKKEEFKILLYSFGAEFSEVTNRGETIWLIEPFNP